MCSSVLDPPILCCPSREEQEQLDAVQQWVLKLLSSAVIIILCGLILAAKLCAPVFVQMLKGPGPGAVAEAPQQSQVEVPDM